LTSSTKKWMKTGRVQLPTRAPSVWKRSTYMVEAVREVEQVARGGYRPLCIRGTSGGE
jgi:hypothetical protein